jgi:UDP-glucose 4-epimerase
LSKALITGGAGFIGSHLVGRLLARGFEVLVVDDLSWGRAEHVASTRGLTFIKGDVSELDSLLSNQQGITHVFHLAALISAYESLEKPDAYFRTNVNGLLRVLELCRRLEGPRLVFASTSGVYGNTPQIEKKETDVPSPATVYAATKLSGEHLLSMYRSRFGYDDVSLRFFNVYGPGQSPKHPYANVTCRFSRAAALGASVELFGDGGQTRDFVYVEDVVEVMLRAATAPIKRRLYNVGTGTEASIADMLETVQRLAGKRVEVQRREAWPNDIRRIRADVAWLREDFGFSPGVTLEEGLQQTIEFFRKAGKDY